MKLANVKKSGSTDKTLKGDCVEHGTCDVQYVQIADFLLFCYCWRFPLLKFARHYIAVVHAYYYIIWIWIFSACHQLIDQINLGHKTLWTRFLIYIYYNNNKYVYSIIIRIIIEINIRWQRNMSLNHFNTYNSLRCMWTVAAYFSISYS